MFHYVRYDRQEHLTRNFYDSVKCHKRAHRWRVIPLFSETVNVRKKNHDIWNVTLFLSCSVCLSVVHFTIKIRKQYTTHLRFLKLGVHVTGCMQDPTCQKQKCRKKTWKQARVSNVYLTSTSRVTKLFQATNCTRHVTVLRRGGEVNTGMKCLTITSSCQIAINYLHGQQNDLNGRRNYRLVSRKSFIQSVSQ